MPRVIGWTRYLVIVPIIGLLLASAALFIFGGIALPIAALSLFIGLRTWSTSKAKRSEREIELLDEHGEELIEAKRRSIENE